MSYLLIFETGEAFTANEILEAHMQGFNAGILDIFDISQPKNVTRLNEDLGWDEVNHD